MLPRENDALSRSIRTLAQAATGRTRMRSFCFLEEGSRRWTVFLVTFPREDGQWRGYFSFRSADFQVVDDSEIRTADLFVETTEAGVDARARALGRPLLQQLLESAIHTYERKRRAGSEYNRFFREVLTSRAAEVSPPGSAALNYEELRSRYESYRIDQVSHLIALMSTTDFKALCENLLAGRVIDFQARDRFQLAMIVVQELERRLTLPPFEVWVKDYLAHAEEYARYSAQLHQGTELP